MEKDIKKKEKYVNLSSKFIQSPSTRHRLVNNKEKNNNLIEYSPQTELNNMFQDLNLNMFDDDDFFKF